MKLLLFLTGIGLGSLVALPGRAQAPRPTHQYYAGMGGLVGSYQLTATRSNSVLAPQLVGGVQLSPWLALEATMLIQHDRTDQSSTGFYQPADTARNRTYPPGIFRSVYQQRTQALTLVARQALLRRPLGRLRLEALLGAALVHSDAYGFNATIDQQTQATVRQQYYTRYDVTSCCLLLGPSVRYQLGPRLALAGEYVANFAPGGPPRTGRNRLSGTLGVSLRYCFGQ